MEGDKMIKINKFTKIHRQAALSGILHDANLIRNNINPIHKQFGLIDRSYYNTGTLKDMHYYFFNDREELNRKLLEVFFRTVEARSLDDVIIIVPRNKSVLNGTVMLNEMIQDKLLRHERKYIKRGNRMFKQGAKVMQIKNNYGKNVVNGEFGCLSFIDDINKLFTIKFNGTKEVIYDYDDINEINLAYAITIHKFQGSQCDTVIIGIDMTSYIMIDACILYTAITRAVNTCYLFSETKAFNYAISNNKNRNRSTYLKKIIKDGNTN